MSAPRYLVARVGFVSRIVDEREAAGLLERHGAEGDRLDPGFTYTEPLADGTHGGYEVTVRPLPKIGSAS